METREQKTDECGTTLNRTQTDGNRSTEQRTTNGQNQKLKKDVNTRQTLKNYKRLKTH